VPLSKAHFTSGVLLHCRFSEYAGANEKSEDRVILSWSASASDAKHPDAVGYGIYRRLKGEDQSTELINSTIPMTSCMGRFSGRWQQVFYEVREISAKEIRACLRT
jgi:hypothetical protein